MIPAPIRVLSDLADEPSLRLRWTQAFPRAQLPPLSYLMTPITLIEHHLGPGPLLDREGGLLLGQPADPLDPVYRQARLRPGALVQLVLSLVPLCPVLLPVMEQMLLFPSRSNCLLCFALSIDWTRMWWIFFACGFSSPSSN